MRLVLLLAVHQLATHQRCHALALSARAIISRKSDGQYKTYSLDDSGSESDGAAGIGGGRDLKSRIDDGRNFLRPSSALHRVQSALRSTFLPALPSNNQGEGNADKLRSSGYLKYILYDNIQDLSTSLRSVLATQRILEGVGVGRADATALSATLNFLIRDGCGMVASLLFTSVAARSFRRNVKRWKYFADVMVDIGITLEVLAPSVLAHPVTEGWFLPLLCLGNVCKALCGVAAGACGGALQMHWAVKLMGTEEGISEVAAKGGAQRTVIGGAGLVLSALVAKWLGSDVRTATVLYCALTSIHLFSNYKSLKLVALDWLNGWRLHLVSEEFLDSVHGTVAEVSIHISNPVEASNKEPLLFLPEWRSMRRQMSMYPIRMGVSFNEFCQLSYRPSSVLQTELLEKRSQRKDNYVLTVERTGKSSRHGILISYLSNSSNSEKAKAYLHSCLVRRALSSLLSSSRAENDSERDTIVQKAEETAQNELVHLWPIFERCVTAAGWKLDKTECSTEGYEMYFES